MSPFTPQNIHHHLNHSTCYIAGVLHQCIYTLQHICADGSFYFSCIQSRSLTLPLHFNTCRMEHLNQEIRLNNSFHVFSLSCMYLPSPFIGSVVSFSNSCDSTPFQMLLYWSTHSGVSETLNDIV